MENKSTGKIVAIVILSLLVVALGGYIVYDKFFVTEDSKKQCITTIEETTEQEETVEEKIPGECPLTKLDTTYVLTDTDKEDIMSSLEALNAGFTRDVVDTTTFRITTISESGYFMNVSFECNPNTSATYASVAKVNDKFKVLTAGSGDTVDGIQRMNYTLERICA